MTQQSTGRWQVPHRRIGTGGPEVSVLSLGSWHTWERMDFHDAVELARFAIDSGVNFFDVAHYNVGPHTEGLHADVIFGRIMQAAGIDRSQYVLGEKVWLWDYPNPDRSLAEQLDRSLFRIGTDHADVLIMSDFAGLLDVPRVVTAISELIRAGKASAWGYNNWSAADARAAHEFATAEGLPAPQMTQFQYSICRRAVVDGGPYRRVFAELGITLQPSDVFEGGILAGNHDPARRIGRDTGGIRDAIHQASRDLEPIAAEYGATLAQLAVAFCLLHPATTSVLFGASRLSQLRDNIGAIELADKHGEQIRARLEPFWMDRDVIDENASWAPTREFAASVTKEDMNPPKGAAPAR